MREIRIYIGGVDAYLNLLQTIKAITIGISAVVIPLTIKVLLLAIGF